MSLTEVFVFNKVYFIYYSLKPKCLSLGVVKGDHAIPKSADLLWGTTHVGKHIELVPPLDGISSLRGLIVPKNKAKCPEIVTYLAVGIATRSLPADFEGNGDELAAPEILASYAQTLYNTESYYKLACLYAKCIETLSICEVERLPTNALVLWHSIAKAMRKHCNMIGFSTYYTHTLYIVLLHLFTIEWQDDQMSSIVPILEILQGKLSGILSIDTADEYYEPITCSESCFGSPKSRKNLTKVRKIMNSMWNIVFSKTQEALKRKQAQQRLLSPNSDETSCEELESATHRSNEAVDDVKEPEQVELLPETVLLKILHRLLLSCDSFPPRLPMASHRCKGFMNEKGAEVESLKKYNDYLRTAKEGGLDKETELNSSMSQDYEHDVSSDDLETVSSHLEFIFVEVPVESSSKQEQESKTNMRAFSPTSRPSPHVTPNRPRSQSSNMNLLQRQNVRPNVTNSISTFRPPMDFILAAKSKTDSKIIVGKDPTPAPEVDAKDSKNIPLTIHTVYEELGLEAKSEGASLNEEVGQQTHASRNSSNNDGDRLSEVDISCYAPEHVQEMAAFAVDFWIDPASVRIEHSRHGSKKGADILRASLESGATVQFKLFNVDSRLHRLTIDKSRVNHFSIMKCKCENAENSIVECNWQGESVCATVILQSREGSVRPEAKDQCLNFCVAVLVSPSNLGAAVGDMMEIGVFKVNVLLNGVSNKVETTVDELNDILHRSVAQFTQPKLLACATSTTSDAFFPHPIHFSYAAKKPDGVCALCSTDPKINSQMEVTCRFMPIDVSTQPSQDDLSNYTHFIIDLRDKVDLAESTIEWARKIIQNANELSRVSVYLPQEFLLRKELPIEYTLGGFEADDVLLQLHLQTMGMQLVKTSILSVSNSEHQNEESNNTKDEVISDEGRSINEESEDSRRFDESEDREDLDNSEGRSDYDESEDKSDIGETEKPEVGKVQSEAGIDSHSASFVPNRNCNTPSFDIHNDLVFQLGKLKKFSLKDLKHRKQMHASARTCDIEKAVVQSQEVIIKWLNLPTVVPADQTNCNSVRSDTSLMHIESSPRKTDSLMFHSLLQELIVQYIASQQGKTAPIIGYVLDSTERFGFVTIMLAMDLVSALSRLNQSSTFEWHGNNTEENWSDVELGIIYETPCKLPTYDRSLISSGDLKRRLIWLHQCAQSLKSLHDIGVVHFDLAPRNVLVDSHLRCFLTDFGLSRVVKNNNKTGIKPQFEKVTDKKQLQNDPRYAPKWQKHIKNLVPLSGFARSSSTFPELYTSPEATMAGRFCTTSSDVYSFGVVMAEVLLGRKPRTSSKSATDTKPIGDKQVSKYQQTNLPETSKYRPLPCLPKSIPHILAKVAYYCWSAPSVRPEIGDIERLLAEIVSHMDNVEAIAFDITL